MTTTVDDALFDSLGQAIEFVGSRGGGTIHTPLHGTQYAKSLPLPQNVKLAPSRRMENEEPKPTDAN